MDHLLFLSYEDDDVTQLLIELIQHLFDMFGLSITKKNYILTPSKSLEYFGHIVNVNGTLSLS